MRSMNCLLQALMTRLLMESVRWYHLPYIDIKIVLLSPT